MNDLEMDYLELGRRVGTALVREKLASLVYRVLHRTVLL